ADPSASCSGAMASPRAWMSAVWARSRRALAVASSRLTAPSRVARAWLCLRAASSSPALPRRSPDLRVVIRWERAPTCLLRESCSARSRTCSPRASSTAARACSSRGVAGTSAREGPPRSSSMEMSGSGRIVDEGQQGEGQRRQRSPPHEIRRLRPGRPDAPPENPQRPQISEGACGAGDPISVVAGGCRDPGAAVLWDGASVDAGEAHAALTLAGGAARGQAEQSTAAGRARAASLAERPTGGLAEAVRAGAGTTSGSLTGESAAAGGGGIAALSGDTAGHVGLTHAVPRLIAGEHRLLGDRGTGEPAAAARAPGVAALPVDRAVVDRGV